VSFAPTGLFGLFRGLFASKGMRLPLAGALGLVWPQVPAIATGFGIIWSLAWRRQSAAVTAIEERDGARFYIKRTSPLQPIQLVRTPGFRSNLQELNGVAASGPVRPGT